MTIEKFIKDDIHYIKQTLDNGAINIFPDPDFQNLPPPNIKPPLPDLSTDSKKLDFIINELRLKNRYSS